MLHLTTMGSNILKLMNKYVVLLMHQPKMINNYKLKLVKSSDILGHYWTLWEIPFMTKEQ